MTCKAFGLVALAAMLCACAPEHSDAPAEDPIEHAAPDDAPAPEGDPAAHIEIAVTAEQLFAGYAENEVAADSVYRSSDLRVSGTVEAVQVDVMDDPVVLLAGDGFSHVQARGLARDAVVRLRKGDQIALHCVGNGAALGSPMLADCRIDSPSR